MSEVNDPPTEREMTPFRLIPWPLPALLAAVLLVFAVTDRAQAVTHFTLENGLEVVVIEDRRAPVVTQTIWYRVGAADEPPGQSGIAHLLEHLMFKGTTNRAPGEFSALVEANGGRENAFTSWDFTAYFQRVAADRLGLMMELEADRMANLAFTDAEWRPERDVILEERGQVVESRPGRMMQEEMYAALFRNHPYGIPIIGWRHEMAALTGDMAMGFYRRHYGPNNAVLVIVGDVDADEVRALAEQHYGPIPPNPVIAPRLRPQEPPQRAPLRLVFEDPRVAQDYMTRTYRVPSIGNGDPDMAAAMQVLGEVLAGSSITSVLSRRLELEERIALQVWAFYSGVSVDDGTFTIGIAPVPGVTLEEAEAALDRAIADFMEQGVDAAQFERVQMQVRAAEIYGLDDLSSRARRIGEAMTSGVPLDVVLGWPERLQSVTPEAVVEAARAVFDPRRSVTGWLVGPAGPSGRMGAPS
jgi:zinc protease